VVTTCVRKIGRFRMVELVPERSICSSPAGPLRKVSLAIPLMLRSR